MTYKSYVIYKAFGFKNENPEQNNLNFNSLKKTSDLNTIHQHQKIKMQVLEKKKKTWGEILKEKRDSTKTSWDILHESSRSFDFVTRQLAKKKRSDIGKCVMLFYNILRESDIIEDSNLPPEEKSVLFDYHLNSLDAADKKNNSNGKLPIDAKILTTNPGYINLVSNFDKILTAYSYLDSDSRSIIKRYTNEMAEGMKKFNSKPIITLDDLDEYCHYVAGIVGYGLSDLFYIKGFIKKPNSKIYDLANDFGLALQKVNITRDYGEDHPDNHFWPTQLLEERGFDYHSIVKERNSDPAMDVLQEMIDNSQKNFEGAIEYFANIPKEQKHVRTFCALPLIMAINTLEVIRNNPEVFNPEIINEDGSRNHEISKKIKTSKPNTIYTLYSTITNANLSASLGINTDFVEKHYRKKEKSIFNGTYSGPTPKMARYR